MTWNKWQVFTKINYFWIEQHITLTLPAWRCLFTVRIIWPYLTPPLSMRDSGVEVWHSLCVPYVPGSRRRTHFVVSVIFYSYSVLYFFSLFPTIANISNFLSHWHYHINLLPQFSKFMFCCKDWNACYNWWYFCIVFQKEITQNKTARNIANFSVLLLFLEKKYQGKAPLSFLSSDNCISGILYLKFE